MYGTYSFSDDIKVVMDDLPEAMRSLLIGRQLRHIFANETESKMLRSFKVKTKDEVDEDKWETEADKVRREYVEKLLDGTLQIRTGGPRGNTIENIAWELAMRQAEQLLSPKGLWPKADRKNGVKAEDATVEIGGRVMNREDITDAVLEKYRETLMEEAKVEHAKRAEKAKLAKANAVAQVKSVGDSLDALI